MRSPKSSEIDFWDNRYRHQAEWTKGLRLHLYRKIGLARCRRVLELGCGTGVISTEIAARSDAAVFGLDRDVSALALASGKRAEHVRWTAGDAAAMPFSSGSFDLVVTHYFWMWVKEPQRVIAECLRVLKPGGYLLSLAEPEYSRGRDTPSRLSVIKEQLSKRLESEGADPDMGPKVQRLFKEAGLKTEAGAVEQGWGPKEHMKEFGKEWQYIEEVLKGYNGLKSLRCLESAAIAEGKRTSMMPIHWVLGRKP